MFSSPGEKLSPKLETEKKLATPEYNFEDWLEQTVKEVQDKLSRQERVVINLAGASASGKGEASDRLKQSLLEVGIASAVFSTDNFYKGISRMVTDNLPNHLSVDELKNINLSELNNYIHELTGQLGFTEKFSPENLAKIKKFLVENYPQVDSDKVMAAIEYEKEHLDFDNPGVVKLDEVAQAIEKIKKGETAEIPNYSMKISEQDGATEINGNEIEAVIVEGLYGLNEKVLGQSDIKSYVEAEIKTLLMRRMRRDVLKGRSTFPPEMNLWITLEIVLPAYKKFILPTRENADSILTNTYTEQETFDTEDYDIQDKLEITDDDVATIEKLCGQAEVSMQQEDYYFTNEVSGNDLEHLIRIRVQDGEIENLIHKGTKQIRDDGRIIRPTEEYIKYGEFGNWYQEPAKLTQAFEGAGFSLVKKLKKARTIFTYQGIELTVDKIEDMGVFVEFRANNTMSYESKIDELKSKLNLMTRKNVGPYIDEALAKPEASE